jgi:hypothetical protein
MSHPASTQRTLPISAALLSLVLAVYACGGRNLEVDDDGLVAAGGASSSELTASSSSVGGDETGAGGAGGQGGKEPEPEPEPSPIDCIGCVANNCPQTLSCLQDPGCVQGIGCALSQCLSSGTPDLGCFVECFEGDTVAAYNAFQAIRCVLEECADSCGTDGFPLP